MERKGDILDHVKYKGSTSQETNIDPSNFSSGDDMEGLLRAAFGVEYIDVSTPEGELRKALAGGLNPVAKSIKSFIEQKNTQCTGCQIIHSSTISWSPSTSAATAQPAQPASSLKASESLVQQKPPVLCSTPSGDLRHLHSPFGHPLLWLEHQLKLLDILDKQFLHLVLELELHN
ncbi:hypothetical protein Cgig2_020636 [Carnegiea gigantea]|uniref:Uncharacterized protein n=1 Tax=Carnegiea gigantea TaxID=171969 RepID=A0A9Q1JZH2_9CARY|nr:hypothetical protein Cgig2_020636 [Carnegiea gigantea]